MTKEVAEIACQAKNRAIISKYCPWNDRMCHPECVCMVKASIYHVIDRVQYNRISRRVEGGISWYTTNPKCSRVK